jgi:hypothetical protein
LQVRILKPVSRSFPNAKARKSPATSPPTAARTLIILIAELGVLQPGDVITVELA